MPRATGAVVQGHWEKDSRKLDIHARTNQRQYQSSGDRGSKHQVCWPSSPTEQDCDSYCKTRLALNERDSYPVPALPTTSNTQKLPLEKAWVLYESDQPARCPRNLPRQRP